MDVPGFEARIGEGTFSLLRNLQVGCEAPQSPCPFPVEKLSAVSPSSPSITEDKKRRGCAFTPVMPSWCKQGDFTFVN